MAYALFTLVDGSRKAVLLGSKAKLCPLTYKAEVVKSELSGSTFASRLRQWLEKETGKQFGVHVPILDSQIVQAMIKKDSYIYNTFAGLRVKEIQDKTDIEAWLHVPSAENIADLLTKGTSPENINTDSIWQNGPSWLLLDQTEWPITKSLVKKEDIDKMNSFIKKSHFQQSLSSKTKQSVILETDNKSVLCKLAGRCGSLSKFLRVVARLRRCIKDRSFKLIMCPQNVGFVGESVSAAEISDAWNYVIAVEQKSLDVRKLANLMPVTVKKLLNDGSGKTHIVIGNRMKKFPIKYRGSDEIPFLQVGEIAQLVVRHYHDKCHCDIDTLVTHIRNDVWIPGLRKLVVEVDKSCVLCIEKRRKFAGQVMGQLPEARTEIQPPFTNCLMDLFGPIVIKDDCVKRGPRVHKKVWGIVFTCASTRALYLDVATDYSSEAIMHAVRRLKFHRGNVKTMVSDPGTQLVAADKELKNWRKGWNEDELQSFGAKEGLVWSFIMPASQHQNGAAEAMVKLAKGVIKSLQKVLGETKLTLNQLFALFAETASIVNSRPIGQKPNSATDPEFLSPNSLLLGRCSDRIDSGPFQAGDMFSDKDGADMEKFLLVQKISDQFWEEWMRSYFPTLLRREKWHYLKRNLSVGDVCLLRDSNALRGDYRMCQVIRVFPDDDGMVRNVEVKVSAKEDGSKKFKSQPLSVVKRHVSNLIVIVPSDDVDVPKKNS